MEHTQETSTIPVTRQAAWNGLGIPLREASTSANVLEQAGLLWNVSQSPIQWMAANGTLQINEQQLCNYRDDTGDLLGVVGKGYTVVQNKTAFAFTDILFEEGVRYERAGSVKGGRLVWLLAKMPEQRIVQDAYAPYLLIINGHDGRTPVNVCMTPIRVACQNTINLALKQATHRWTFTHTINVMNRMNDAQQTLALASEYMKRLETTAEKLVAMKMSQSELSVSVNRLFPMKGTAISDKHTQENIDRFMQCYNESDLDNVRGTAYGFLMAISDYTTHVPFRTNNITKARERHFMKTVMQPDPLLATAFDMFAI